MTTNGIAGIGVALPALRVTRASHADAWGTAPRTVERRATPAFDEDEVTLAVAAARRALASAGVEASALAGVAFATMGPARAAATVAEALGAESARLLDVAGRRGAGITALATALDASGPWLVVAADVPRAAPGGPGEAEEGAAAVALVVAPGGAVRGRAASVAGEFPGADVVEASGDATLASLLARADVRAHAAFVVLAGASERTKGLPAKPGASLRARVGDAGAAAPLLDLAAALGKAAPGSRGLVAVADAGSADVLALEVDRPVAPEPGPEALAAIGRDVGYVLALRHRRVLVEAAGFHSEPMGAYVSLPDFARSLPSRYRLVAARCRACSRLAFPPRAACAACGTADFDPVPLSGRGVVESFTTIARGGAPSELAAEQAMVGDYVSAVVRLEEGPKVAARLADVDAKDVAIGTSVVAVLRRLYEQQGAVRYGFKFARA